MLTDQALAAAVDGVAAVLYLVVMLSTMPGPTMGVLIVAFMAAALAVIVGRPQARLQRRETEAQARQRDFLIELLAGVATIKASGSEARGLRQWLERLRLVLSLRLRRQRISIWNDVGMGTLTQSLTVVLLIWGAILVLRGESTLGSLLAFLQMSAGFVTSILGLISIYLAIKVLKPRLAELTEILAVDPQPRPRHGRARSLTGPVVIEKVWFRYNPNAPWIVKDLNMEVQPGEKRWIRGPSGAGKSTILRLISGLYPPERGTIRIGGREPGAANDLMIYLPQLLQLYGGSILENLRLFSGNASRERLMEAAEASGLNGLISRLPLGFETIVPSGGMTLSGGERQLVAMTAVMASERSVFLLDEAMVSLDWIARSHVESNRWFEGKTVIYASHDGFAGDAMSTFLPKKSS
jgi:ABC-type bacteriocin/lantibiotic exporter with double-glycine peptidase domain